ncbi:MAG: twin-arginine translocase TatA/TatE family subunit [SAR202 cluster bacterium]|nr:twin-arginine translocase TatA/TatE family subunit [SAR202 cluster bacterium]
MRFGPTELIIVLVIVLIIFGVGKLPEIGGAMGKAIREFKHSQADKDENKEGAAAASTGQPAAKKE